MSREWREVLLEEIADVIVSNVDKKSRPGQRPVRLCNYTDVYKHRAVRPDMDLMAATATRAEIERFHLRVGDVLITKDSEDPKDIAVPTVVEETAPDLVCGYHLAIIRPGPEADGSFLKHSFDLPETRAYFGSRANGATRFGLTVRSIEKAVLRLPSLQEQRKIAHCLRIWEATIEKLEAVLAAKERQRRGLIQAMLGGHWRIPAFENRPWRRIPLGEVLNEHGLQSAGYEAVFSVSVRKGVVNQKRHLGRSFAAKNKDHYRRVLPGDIVYTRSPTGRFPLGIIKRFFPLSGG